jgi:TonB family protein
MTKLFYSTIFLLVFTFTNVFSQETVEVKDKNKQERFTEIYHVLKKNKKIKHGKYLKENVNGQILISGSFNEGIKEGLWIFHNYRGDTLKKGYFSDSIQAGIWTIYARNKTKYSYNFENNSVSGYQWDEDEIREVDLNTENGIIRILLDNPALPKTEIGLNNQVYEHVKYPPAARDSGVSGQVIVSVTVNADGTSEEPTIKFSVYPSLDEESLRVIRHMSNNWIPASYNGENVRTENLIPINFVLR